MKIIIAIIIFSQVLFTILMFGVISNQKALDENIKVLKLAYEVHAEFDKACREHTNIGISDALNEAKAAYIRADAALELINDKAR